jgi:hypothetical protein
MSRFIKIPFASFGLALALLMPMNLVLLIAGVDISPSSARVLFMVCFLVSIPVAVKYLR